MNEENLSTEKHEFKLVPLTNDQHEVSLVGKVTTDLPFFYLTKRKELLAQPIKFEGTDSEGRPMRWTATPNSAIGSPSIDAHEVWTRLVKPTWEAYRTPDDRLPNILPLGGLRQCLRVVGWGIGGWEGRRLLKALNQIGATWCAADFWIPTRDKSEDGKPTFRAIKGNFSRLTIFAIGSKHLSDDELREGKFSFEFDLEDTIYLQFHPLEVAIQESQPQRYLDNQYMFSVGPAARRWYELMAAKMFGVVKNRGEYCEVLYSWYVTHHHTLRRSTSRRRVAQQIKEIVREHLDSKFISKVELRKLKEPGQEIDFVIRFYPGRTAKDSISRVLSSINKKRLPAGAPGRISRHRNREDDVIIFTAAGAPEEETEPEIVEIPATPPTADLPFVAQLTERGIFRAQAINLIASIPPDQLDRVGDYVDYWDSIPLEKRGPGLLYTFIQQNDPLPASFETGRQRQARQAKAERFQRVRRVEEALAASYEKHREAVIEEYITTAVQHKDFDELVAAERERMLQQDLWVRMSPERVTATAERFVRGQIAKGAATISFEDYRREELPRMLEELALNPAELGIELDETPVTDPDGKTTPDAQNDAPLTVSSEDEVFSRPNINSSPGLV